MSEAVEEGTLLWTPDGDFVEKAQLTRFMRWLGAERNIHFEDYATLWRWSVDDLDGFWRAIYDYFSLDADGDPEAIVTGEAMFLARWFPGVRLNFAEHLLRHEAVAEPGEIALYHSSEIRPLATLSWAELGSQVRAVATRLRAMGIKAGDMVVSIMPNVPETAVAMLATTAIGAIWSSAAPEFGPAMVLDRFRQLRPKLAFVGNGYSFNGRVFDRRDEVAEILSNLPSLEMVVTFDYLDLAWEALPYSGLTFAELLASPAIGRDEFRYERLPSEAPLWVLFSSGTTGLPKAIVHSHIGMTLEQLKNMSLSCNLGPGKRMFFYTTTGWMMWNAVISALITGASAVLYDGSPVFGGPEMLWKMAAVTGTTSFGASPTLVKSMNAAGIKPKNICDLSHLDMVLLGGAPSTPETFKWFYDNVKADLWVSSQSGGTDLCSGLVTGVAIQPVYAGEIQAAALGIAVDIWDEHGNGLVDEEGELVVTRPFPSAPLCFLGDEDNGRYHDSYFSTYPGVWRHGDLAKRNERGGVYVYGRSDSTLNRYGVRIGTGEIYRPLDDISEIEDSLVICCEMANGNFYMPMFVALRPGAIWSAELEARIVETLRLKASPRHVPDEFVVAPGIPYTVTGKKMEVPIRKLVIGASPEQAASRDIMARPDLLNWYIEFARQPNITERRRQIA
ncbi:MAG: acetoacetate--CoA ligase [Candidatus Sphingomonas colombiensis]|nr:acetoacetate--CoA ligase [Sphingomonas sp.]WEK42223.1 MAG: acetoacetate--CoA ligase [Sphingomonas sp.]